LLAGISTVMRALRPEAMIIGVEPERAASFCGALRRSKPVRVATGITLADGLAVAKAGARAFAIAASRVDGVVTVSEAAIAQAIRLLATAEGAIVEGAGAVGLAALLGGDLKELARKKIVLVVTGGNIDPRLHRGILDHKLDPFGMGGSLPTDAEEVPKLFYRPTDIRN